MCDRRWAIGILLIGTLLLGAVSDAAAQWGNPTYMNHFAAPGASQSVPPASHPRKAASHAGGTCSCRGRPGQKPGQIRAQVCVAQTARIIVAVSEHSTVAGGQ